MSTLRGWVAASMVVTLCGGLSACGAHADRRAASGDVCVSALPVAAPVAGAGATLIRIKHLSASQTRSLLPAAGSTATLCAVAYRGAFDVSRLAVTAATSGTTGPVLVLLLSTRHPRVLGALVLHALPPELVH